MSTVCSEVALIRRVCRASFKEFCKEFWPEVPGAGKLVWSWHMDVFCEELQIIAERIFKNQPREYDLIENEPPGTSKSTIHSILYLNWLWTRMPELRFMAASHTDMLCLDLSTKCRTVVLSEKYRECFPEIVLRDDQAGKGYFANTKGLDRLTCTVAGKSPVGFSLSHSSHRRSDRPQEGFV